MMLKVYTASRYPKAQMWIDIQNREGFRHYFHARWLQHYKLGTRETPENSHNFWQENIRDIEDADIVLYYTEPDDVMGGALIEVGAAIVLDKTIIVAGTNESNRSWIYHPAVLHRCDTLEEALDQLDFLTPGYN